MLKINTERLLLREFNLNDAKELITIAKQEHICKWLPDFVGFENFYHHFFNDRFHAYKLKNPSKETLAFAVVTKDNNELIGQIGVGGDDKEVGMVYFISEKYTNKGYATEATKGICDYVFENFNYDYIMATVQPDNISSNKVLQKAGFKYISTIMKLDPGQTEELPFNYYQLLRT